MLTPYLIELMKEYGTDIVFMVGLFVICVVFILFHFLLKWQIYRVENEK